MKQMRLVNAIWKIQKISTTTKKYLDHSEVGEWKVEMVSIYKFILDFIWKYFCSMSFVGFI